MLQLTNCKSDRCVRKSGTGMSPNQGDVMRTFVMALCALAGVSGFAGKASAMDAEVALCTYCTQEQDYEYAAAQAVQALQMGQQALVLVVNPNTGTSRFVDVYYSNPTGPTPEVPLSTGPGSTTTSPARTMIVPGRAYPIPSDPFRQILLSPPPRGFLQQNGLNPQSRAPDPRVDSEVAAAIQYVRDTHVITAPSSDLFSSFSSRNEPAVANLMNSSLAARNPGHAVQQIGLTVRNRLIGRLRSYFGKDDKVCVIFNNGDSACYRPNFYTPSIENLIPNTAQDRNGASIADGLGGTGGGTSSSDGLQVHYNPPNYIYYVNGEYIRSCAWIGTVFQGCWISPQ